MLSLAEGKNGDVVGCQAGYVGVDQRRILICPVAVGARAGENMAERVEFAVLGQVGECRQRRDWCPLQCVEPELVGGAVVERLHRGWQVFIICGGCPLAGYIVDPECTVARVSAEHYCFCRVRGNGVDISGASAVDTQLVGYGRCRQCPWRQGFAGEIPYCGCIEKHGIDPLAFRIVDSGRRDAGDRW